MSRIGKRSISLDSGVDVKQEGNIVAVKGPKGTGLIACWSLKMALEAAGLHNIVCKIVGSTNPINVLGALKDAITNLKTKTQIRQLRGNNHNQPTQSTEVQSQAA